jgi:hypothetical protein
VNDFVKSVSDFVDALGYDEPGIVLTLAQVPWESDNDRQEFIKSMLRNEGQ